MVLTGDTGTGKTSLLHFVADSVEETAYSILFHATPPTLEPLLWSLCHHLALRVDSRNATTALEEVVLSLRARSYAGETIALFIDEAQNLDRESFACLAHILASENSRGKLLQVVLFGTSELNTIFAQPELQPLQRHLAVMLRLAPLQSKKWNCLFATGSEWLADRPGSFFS
jgi:MSHA biogenesis protein MshM